MDRLTLEAAQAVTVTLLAGNSNAVRRHRDADGGLGRAQGTRFQVSAIDGQPGRFDADRAARRLT